MGEGTDMKLEGESFVPKNWQISPLFHVNMHAENLVPTVSVTGSCTILPYDVWQNYAPFGGVRASVCFFEKRPFLL